MGDRAVIIFANSGVDVAAIYTHWGGSEVDDSLYTFFVDEDRDDRYDNRFADPAYLAARYVTWASNTNGSGIGIVRIDHREYTNVRVHCDNQEHPRIEHIERETN